MKSPKGGLVGHFPDFSESEGDSSGLNSDFVIENDEIELLSAFKSTRKSLQEPLNSLYNFSIVGSPKQDIVSLAGVKNLTAKLGGTEQAKASKSGKRPLLLRSLPVAMYEKNPETLTELNHTELNHTELNHTELKHTGLTVNTEPNVQEYSLEGMTFDREKMTWTGADESYLNMDAFDELGVETNRLEQDEREYSEFAVPSVLRKAFKECEASHKLFISLWYPRAFSVCGKSRALLKASKITCGEYLKLCTNDFVSRGTTLFREK